MKTYHEQLVSLMVRLFLSNRVLVHLKLLDLLQHPIKYVHQLLLISQQHRPLIPKMITEFLIDDLEVLVLYQPFPVR